MVWFHDIGVHVNSALIFISIFTEPAHSLFDITFQYTTFLERTCLACLISILNGSVFWFHGIGIHVNLALLLSALRWAHKIGLRIKSEKLYRSGEVELFSFFEGLSFVSWYFDWFSILISLNWRARPARSLTFGITLSTEQGCQYSLEKFPLSGEVELFSFFEDLSFGSWHFDWFCLLIFSRNWRACQARFFTFGITLSTEQGCTSSLEKFPLSGEVESFSFFRGPVCWLLAFGQVQYFDFTELACTSSLLLHFRHYVEHRTWLRIILEKFPLQREVELFSFFRGPVYWLRPFRLVQSFDFMELACTSRLLFYFRHYVEHGTGLPIKSEKFLAFRLDVF